MSDRGAAEPKAEKRGGHLYEVDIVRIVTFAGVILNHCVSGTTFPTNVAANGVQMVFRYTREAFFALTGFVLTYQYRDREMDTLGFWRRRYKTAGIPFLVWSVFYWLYQIYVLWPPAKFDNLQLVFGTWQSTKDALEVLGYNIIAGTAWYHLYFLFVTLQVYLLFPLILKILRRTWGYHRYLLAASFVFHVVLMEYMSTARPEIFNYGILAQLWDHLPGTIIAYQFFTLLGCVAALHLDATRAFARRYRVWLIVLAVPIVAATVAYYLRLTDRGVPPVDAANIFQPYTVVMFVAIIAALYAAGTYWADRRSPGSFWDRFLRTSSDRSFGIFLVHAFALQELAPTIQRFRLEFYAPLVTTVTFVVTAVFTVALTEVLRRTPVSLYTTGRPMIPMSVQTLRGSVQIGAAMVVVGAVAFWGLNMPGGGASMVFGGALLLWQLLGRTVFAGPAGARAVR